MFCKESCDPILAFASCQLLYCYCFPHTRPQELSVSYSSQSTVSLQETLWRQQEQAKSHLDSFFQCVFVGDLNALKEFLSQEPSPVADTSALCHPLCECDKCQKVITEKQQEKEEMKVSLDSYDDRGWTGNSLNLRNINPLASGEL